MAIHLGAVIGLTSLFGQNEIVSAICTTGLLSQWETDFDTDATVTDQAATGTHDAINPISVYSDAASHGTLGSAITQIGDFTTSISVRPVVLGTAGQNRIILAGNNTTEGLIYVVGGTNYLVVIFNGNTYSFTNLILLIDTAYDITFSRVGTDLTATVSGVGTQVLTCDTANVVTRYIGVYVGTSKLDGYFWDLTLSDTTSGVLFSNTLASGASSTVSASAVPAAGANDVTWTGLTVPGDWKTDDPRWGHSYNREDFVIASGAGTYSIGSYLPASYTSEGTLYTGTALQNLDVDAASVGVFDSSAYATFANPITLVGDFKVRFTINFANSPTAFAPFLAGSTGVEGLLLFRGFSGATKPYVVINDISYGFTIGPVVSGTLYTGAFTRVGDQLTLELNAASETITVNTANMVLRDIAKFATHRGPGTYSDITIENPIGTIVNKYPVQAASDSTQTTIYDVGPSANHATIAGGTFPTFWQGTADESWLAQWGGKLSGGVTIPGRTTGLAADGGALTFSNYLDAPANVVTITVPETAEMFGAAPGLFTTGDPDATDPSTISDGDEDEIRKSDVAILVTNPAQTGACRDETDIYLGI